MKVVDLDREVILEPVDNVPEESKIFEEKHIRYVDALTGELLLNSLKGQLLNIVEGLGLPDRQETAAKRMVTSALHETHHEVTECLKIVRMK